LTQPILISWNDNTKAITDSDYGIDALQVLANIVQVFGTLSLAPITSTKTDIDLTLTEQHLSFSEGY
jgi:hypothetical protein